MAKKQPKPRNREQRPVEGNKTPETKTGQSFKDILSEGALAKLKLIEKDVKATKEREEQEAVEQRRREMEEKERNKGFAELLNDFEKKGGGKYS